MLGVGRELLIHPYLVKTHFEGQKINGLLKTFCDALIQKSNLKLVLIYSTQDLLKAEEHW